MASKTITFTLSHISKTISFDLDTFSSDIGLEPSDDCVYVPPKETMKDGLATLGLVDEDHPSFSSSALINSSPMKVKYFLPTWKSLLPPSGEVNVVDTADKSLSGTFVPPVTQPKAQTAKRPRKKKIPSLTQPECAEEFMVTADATKSLDASESAEVQGNQPETADAAK
ncbi:hypothetical protein Tco_0035676, partial [Tanacetum coccineum]